MSQTNELLNSLTDDEMALYSADPSTEPYIIINDDRTITVPDELKRIAVQNDHNIETVTFICPTSWGAELGEVNDEIDILIYINYVCSDGSIGSYRIEFEDVLEYDFTHVTFPWVISKNVTKVPGKLKFNICIKATDSEGFELYHWNTEICEDMYIAPGLDCVDQIIEAYPDIFAQIVEKVNGFDSSTVVFKTVEGAEIDNVTNDDRVLFFKQPGGVRYTHAPFDSAVIFTQVPLGSGAAILGGISVAQTALADDGTVWKRTLEFNSEDPPGYRAATVDWVTDSYVDNSLQAKVSSGFIRLDDVSPIEHTIKAKVSGKNLFSGELITGYFNSADFGIENSGSVAYRSIKIYLQTGTYTFSFGTAVNIIRMVRDGIYSIVNGAIGVTTYTIDVASDEYIGISFRDTSSADTAWNDTTPIQIEAGNAVTEYEPGIDPTTVTVTRYGKNLLDVTKAESIVVGANGVKRNGIIFDKTGTYTFSCVIPSGIAVKVVTDGEYGPYTTLSNNVTYAFTLAENQYLIIYQGAEGLPFTTNLKNAQIEVGNKATEYEPYCAETYTPDSDGLIDMVSISPTMTLFTDVDGANINFEYYRFTDAFVEDFSRQINVVLKEQVGDIETALDSILAMQGSLIGGGA